MHRRVIIIFFILLFAAFPLMAEEEEITKLDLGADRWISLHLLLQAQAYTQNEYDAEAGESKGDAVWVKEFQLRRSRVMFNGEAAKDFEFFFSTGDFFVKNGSNTSSSIYTTSADENDGHTHTVETEDSSGMYVQDAYINYRFMDELEIAAGLMPVPFMRQNMESSVSLLGLDYNSLSVPMGTSESDWRDTGLMIRGLLANAFEYRFGVFRGQERDLQGTEETSDDINANSAPRFCFRFQMNFLDPEDGFFYSGNYLGKKSLVSVGGGVDYQSHAARVDDKISSYLAWTFDLNVDYKISRGFTGTFQTAYVNVTNNPESNIEQQSGYYAQAGLLIENIQPVIRYQTWDTEKALNINPGSSYLSFGINYFMSGHNANIKFEYRNPVGDDNKSLSGEKKAVLQGQIFL
ncbi:MAG: hypothetical protein JW864_02770 [Spirochaetes bacterium]|nr:hypothetical protein [Spirochaetota bacterium]